jgi:rhodanese-related sulfurtransferase
MQKPFVLAGPPALEPEELATRIAAGKAPFMVDVRDPDEYRAGHIAATVPIPMAEVPGRLGEIPSDQQVVCICLTGARSGRVAHWLNTKGYQAVNMRGGMQAWTGAVEVSS